MTTAAATPALDITDVNPTCSANAASAAADSRPAAGQNAEAAPVNTIARMTHSLDELERLAEILAVDDGYEPAARDFVVPRNFKLSVVIPVYNEQCTIQRVLAQVAALPIPKE